MVVSLGGGFLGSFLTVSVAGTLPVLIYYSPVGEGCYDEAIAAAQMGTGTRFSGFKVES